ncbi:DsbA family protein [Agarivorans sp. 1_MG-2023]|uniref:DsbA family protein n=1 Tax=Agarivorans sp. 1_MG-2023 TaxID=3062634 RepID=UPI0026E16B29|nr:DsbA family protein [Agarivorans sp. 1_MG-2023]MDO6765891.1 DsbA family protein [Agarivorans sp. 1_MG-2023]
MTETQARLYYVHDPMCSWCWGYKPTLEALESSLPSNIEMVYLLGGLAPDSAVAMPEDMQQFLQQTWQKINVQLGTEFNHDFWKVNTPRRSTYPANRAVLAAEKQGAAKAMIRQIQNAYYLQAINPSDVDNLLVLAEKLGLDKKTFVEDISSEALNESLMQQIQFARSLPIQGFPSLVLAVGESYHPVQLDYKHAQVSLEHVAELLV